MIKWPDKLVNSLARRRCVLFLGAGISMNSTSSTGKRPPSWVNFLERAIEACDPPHTEMKKLLKKGEMLSCCEIIQSRLGKRWFEIAESEFSTPQYKPHKIHEHIFRLDANVVVTPNIDRIYDSYAVSQGGGNTIIKKYYDDDISRSIRGSEQQRLIVKIHGCIDTPSKMVFSRSDYRKIQNNHGNFYRSIESLIMTNDFLFLGCGLNDPDINLILERYSSSFENSPLHYFVSPSVFSKEYKKVLEDNYHLQAISYGAKKDDHTILVDSLGTLVELVQSRRTDLAATQLW